MKQHLIDFAVIFLPDILNAIPKKGKLQTNYSAYSSHLFDDITVSISIRINFIVDNLVDNLKQ